MAVYYKWIKGCSSGANLDSGLWTYINWGNKSAFSSSDTNQTEALPQLYARIGKDDTSINSSIDTSKGAALGYILTNNVKGVEIYQDWVFSPGKNINFGNCGSIRGINTNKPGLKLDGEIHLGVNTENKNDGYFSMSVQKWVESNSVDEKGCVNIFVKTYIGKTGDNFTAYFPKYGSSTNSKITSKLWITGRTEDPTETAASAKLYVNGLTYVNGSIYASAQCEATYFNATSDKRAKENIQPATYNALSLIEKLPIYTYNYINDKDVVTGILAQDLLQVQPKELNLVSNTNATGENNDYMSIKNDKLMFVLMKAIQEQQEEIKQLKIEIEKLKNK